MLSGNGDNITAVSQYGNTLKAAAYFFRVVIYKTYNITFNVLACFVFLSNKPACRACADYHNLLLVTLAAA